MTERQPKRYPTRRCRLTIASEHAHAAAAARPVIRWSPSGWTTVGQDAADPHGSDSRAAATKPHKRIADESPRGDSCRKRSRRQAPSTREDEHTWRVSSFMHSSSTSATGAQRARSVLVVQPAGRAGKSTASTAAGPIQKRGPTLAAIPTVPCPVAATARPTPLGRRPLSECAPLEEVRVLGCGTFGCVREVLHTPTGRRWALKEMGLLPVDYRAARDGPVTSAFRPGVSPASVHMVFRELAAIAAMRGHPSVVPVRDARLSASSSSSQAPMPLFPVASPSCPAGGLRCVVLMDLMDGHLGRVIRLIGGRESCPSTHSAVAAAASSSFSSRAGAVPSWAGRDTSCHTPLSSTCTATPTTSPSVARSGATLPFGAVVPDPRGPASASPSSPSGTMAAPPRACDMAVRVEVARLVARGVLPALAFMHDGMGMAHRDVKPNNILYRGDMATGTLRFYLSDFGLARFVRYPSDEAEEPARARRAVRSHAPTRAHGGGDDDDDDDGEGKEDGARDTVGGREGRDPAGGAPQAEDPSDAEGDDAEADAGAARPEDRRPGPFTANVITHMYKPPEVLLAYRHRHSVEHGIRYTTAVDMWSLGIVLLEVLAGGHLTPTHPESTLDERMRAVLCVGSPADAGPNGGARTARMATLTQGAPSDEQIAAHAAHVRGMIKKIVARGLMGRSGMGSTASVLLMTEGAMEPYTDVIDLIERLVCIDPRRRIAARDALLHPFVAGTTDDATAADAGTSVTVPTAPASDSRGSNDDVVDRPSAPGETGDGTTGRRPKGRARPRGTRHDVQPESDIYDHDGQGRNEGKEGRGSTPALLRPWFLGACAYRALSAESPRAKERPRADCGDVSPTVAARRLAVTRMCQFADRHRFHPRTIAGAVLMLDHYLDAVATPRASDAAQKGCQGGGEGGRGCDDPNLLVAGAGALFIMSSLYETRWPSLEDYATMGRVPASWYADRKPPTASIRYPTSDAVLRASVDVFEAVNHLVPSQRAVASVLGSARIAAARCEADFWRTLTSALARYPPGVRRS